MPENKHRNVQNFMWQLIIYNCVSFDCKWSSSSLLCSSAAKSRHETKNKLAKNFLLLFFLLTRLLLLRELADVFGSILCCFRYSSQWKHSFIFTRNGVGERHGVDRWQDMIRGCNWDDVGSHKLRTWRFSKGLGRESTKSGENVQGRIVWVCTLAYPHNSF